MFKRLFSTSNPLIAAARNLGLAGTHSLGPLKKEVIKFAMG